MAYVCLAPLAATGAVLIATFEGASILAFPALGADFRHFVSAHAHKSFRRRIPVADLSAAFERFQHQPRALIDLVFLYVSGDKPVFRDVRDSRIESLLASDQYQPVLDQMTSLQRQICQRVAARRNFCSLHAKRHIYRRGRSD